MMTSKLRPDKIYRHQQPAHSDLASQLAYYHLTLSYLATVGLKS